MINNQNLQLSQQLPEHISFSAIDLLPKQSWSFSLKSERNIFINDIIVNEENGEITVVGKTNGESVDIGSDLSFALQLDNLGAIKWYSEWGRDTEEYGWGDFAKSVDIDSEGNIYITGRVSQGVILDTEETVGTSDGYLMKLNKNGEMVWTKYITLLSQNCDTDFFCGGWSDGYEVYTANDSSILVASTQTDLDNSNDIGYLKSLRKYDESGNLLWEKILYLDGGYGHVTDILPGAKDSQTVRVFFSGVGGFDPEMYSIELEDGSLSESWNFPNKNISSAAMLPDKSILVMDNLRNTADIVTLSGDVENQFGETFGSMLVIDNIIWGSDRDYAWANGSFYPQYSIRALDLQGNQLLKMVPTEDYDYLASLYGYKSNQNQHNIVMAANKEGFNNHEIIISSFSIPSSFWAPTDIQLTSISFDENIVDGSLVANLSTVDKDLEDTHTYLLVDGDGDTDNNAFTIDGDQLKINASPDYETQDSYAVRLRTEDSGGLTFEKSFTLIVNDLDEVAPDVDVDGFVDGVSNYQMWTSSGVIDLTNKKGRTVSDDTSKKWDAIKAIQTDSGFSILLRGDRKKQGKFQIVSANENGVWQEASPWKSALKMFESGNEHIFDTDFNGNGQIGFIAPTEISLSSFSFNENISSGSVVSNLSSTDLDPDDTHTYSLVSGSGDIHTGDTHNSLFSIKGDKLIINESPDYETQSSYSIRIKTTDSSGGLSYEAPFTLNVNDLDDKMNENVIDKPAKFNKKLADKIINFNPSIDTLKIDTESFSVDGSATFAVGKNKKNVKKKLANKDFDFLYDQKKGDMYFNENGADKGFGDGGIVAIIKGAPDLTIQNIEFL